jgi:hypothetical protein
MISANLPRGQIRKFLSPQPVVEAFAVPPTAVFLTADARIIKLPIIYYMPAKRHGAAVGVMI